jgi:hypothetical protein
VRRLANVIHLSRRRHDSEGPRRATATAVCTFSGAGTHLRWGCLCPSELKLWLFIQIKTLQVEDEDNR